MRFKDYSFMHGLLGIANGLLFFVGLIYGSPFWMINFIAMICLFWCSGRSWGLKETDELYNEMLKAVKKHRKGE